MEDVLIIAIAWIGSIVISFITGYLQLKISLAELQSELTQTRSDAMRVMGVSGANKRAEQSARMEEALGKAMLIMQDEKITDKKAAIMQLALEYPELALKMVGKLGIKF